jgi:hypothetical protein
VIKVSLEKQRPGTKTAKPAPKPEHTAAQAVAPNNNEAPKLIPKVITEAIKPPAAAPEVQASMHAKYDDPAANQPA